MEDFISLGVFILLAAAIFLAYVFKTRKKYGLPTDSIPVDIPEVEVPVEEEVPVDPPIEVDPPIDKPIDPPIERVYPGFWYKIWHLAARTPERFFLPALSSEEAAYYENHKDEFGPGKPMLVDKWGEKQGI